MNDPNDNHRFPLPRECAEDVTLRDFYELDSVDEVEDWHRENYEYDRAEQAAEWRAEH